MAPRKKALTTTLETESVVEVKVEKATPLKNPTIQLESLRSQIAKELNTAIDLLIAQVTKVEQTKKQAQEEILSNEKQNKQIVEEKQFNTMMDQKKKQAEFEEKLTSKAKEFEEKKTEELAKLKAESTLLAERKREFDEYKKQVDNFPSQLEKAIDETKKTISLEYKKEFEAEKRFLVQKNEYDLKLIQQQIVSLQQINKQQEKDIQSLREEKAKAIDQINQLAVTVIKGKDVVVGAPHEPHPTLSK